MLGLKLFSEWGSVLLCLWNRSDSLVPALGMDVSFAQRGGWTASLWNAARVERISVVRLSWLLAACSGLVLSEELHHTPSCPFLPLRFAAGVGHPAEAASTWQIGFFFSLSLMFEPGAGFSPISILIDHFGFLTFFGKQCDRLRRLETSAFCWTRWKRELEALRLTCCISRPVMTKCDKMFPCHCCNAPKSIRLEKSPCQIFNAF